MLKKMVILAVVGFVAVAAISGTKVASFFRSEYKSFREQAEESVPPEKEIARLKNEVSLLDGDIRKLVHHLAKERVDVNQLKDKVDEMNAKQGKYLAQYDDQYAKLEAAEKNQTQQVSFGGAPLSISDARRDLDAQLSRLENNKKSIAAHESLLSNRIKVRDTLEKQLEAMKNQKSELANSVDAMEAELAALKLQQMESKYQTDDTRLAKIKEDMQKLKTKVAVECEKLNLMPTIHDEGVTVGKSADEMKARRDALTKQPTPKADANKKAE